MPKLGILFDIDALGGGMYGHAAYKIFFAAVDSRRLAGCSLSDGDTHATLTGKANHYCIAVEALDAARIAFVRNAMSRCDSPALLPIGSRFLDDHLVVQEPLVAAAQVAASGEVVGTGWIMEAWKDTRPGHLEAPVSMEIPSPVFCTHCGSPVSPDARFCPKCGMSHGIDAGKPAVLPAASPDLGLQALMNVYSPVFDMSRIPPQQAEKFKNHSLVSTFPAAMVVVLHILTLGIFTMIFHGLKHSRFPAIRHDDFRAGRAIGFMCIPFYNFYWLFVFWLRLADRVNFQFRLRNLPDPVSRGLVQTACILGLIPYIGLISFIILYPIAAAQIQSACNQLVMMGGELRYPGRI